MSLSTSKIVSSKIVSSKIEVKDDPLEDNDAVNMKFVSNNFIKNNIGYDDVPSTLLSGTNFSFRHMADDLIYLENQIFTNTTIKSIIDTYNANKDLSYPKTVLNQINVLITNICRNFVNNPDRVCFDPNCFYKRVQILTSGGQPFIDVATYKNDSIGIKLKLNHNRDIVYFEFKDYHFLSGVSTPVVISNPHAHNLDNIREIGVLRKRRVAVYTDPDLDDNGKYLYPLNVSNPQISQKTPVAYENAQGSYSQDVSDAIKNGRGWLAKVSASNGNNLGYFFSDNLTIPVGMLGGSDEHNVIFRLSYQIYQ